MISDETFDKVREAWAMSIPEQYRWRAKERGSNDFAAAIILAPTGASAGSLLCEQDQLRANAAREACGRSGVRT